METRGRGLHIAWTGGAGLLASLVMYFFIYLGIEVSGLAPFNSPPSEAFLYNIGVEGSGYALALHFCYGMLWSYVLVYTFEEDLTVLKAIGLAVVLWLFMMIVYSPLIGWGMFGFGYAHLLEPDHLLYLREGPDYVLSSLLLHLVYGTVLGAVNVYCLREAGFAGESH